MKNIHKNNIIPSIPVKGYILPTNFLNGNSPNKKDNMDIIKAIILELYLYFLEILSHMVQKFGAAVEKIPHNNIIEKI